MVERRWNDNERRNIELATIRKIKIFDSNVGMEREGQEKYSVTSKTDLEMMQRRSIATEGIPSQIECKTHFKDPLFQPCIKQNMPISTISSAEANDQ